MFYFLVVFVHVVPNHHAVSVRSRFLSGEKWLLEIEKLLLGNQIDNTVSWTREFAAVFLFLAYF